MLSSCEQLQKALLNILKEKYKVHDETLTEKLLSYLSAQSLESRGLSEDFLLQWIHEFIGGLNRGIDKSVLPFVLRFAGQVFAQQHIFIQLKLQNVLETIRQLIDPFLSDSKLRYCYVAMLEPLSKHKPGCLWLINSGAYIEVLKFFHQQSNIYLLRVAELLLVQVPKLIARDSPNHLPSLLDNLIISLVEGDLNVHSPDITIVSKLLENALRDSSLAGKRLSEYILADGALIPRLEAVVRQATTDSTFEFSVAELLILSLFADSRQTANGRSFLQNDQNNLQLLIFQFLTILIKKHSILNTLKIAKLLSSSWDWFFKEHRIQDPNENAFLFENQIICFQLTPLFAAQRLTPQSEYFEEFVQRVLKVTSHETIRMVYTFRNAFINEEEALLYIPICLELILNNIQEMNRTHAIYTFQSIMYLTKEFIPFKDTNHTPIFESKKTILAYLLHCIIRLIRQFQFTWRETVETMCLFTVAGTILSLSEQFHPKTMQEKEEMSLSSQTLDKRICVHALQLLREATLYSMQPDLALITNRVDGSPMELIGPMLLRIFKDTRWEVRDSTLEFLLVLLNISESKFPALQEHIVKYKLIPTIAEMAVEDPEPYVRASAITCLTACLRIDCYWREHLSKPTMIETLLILLSNEQEGLVRKEIATWFSVLYSRGKVPSECQQKIYLAMYAAARSDLHWEVVSAALGFWHRVVVAQLNQQGMLDGEFPSHTFDKENRKIIILTEDHIRRRILRALEELGQLGCLTILLSSLDVYELNVVRKAVEILQFLSKYLLIYNVKPSEKIDTAKKQRNGLKDQSCSSHQTPIKITPQDNSKREDVIKDICNLRDIQLLEVVKVEKDFKEENKIKNIVVEKMDANEFLTAFYSTNFEQVLEDKTGWVASAGEDIVTILQDLLQAPYELDASVNSLDCY